MYAGPSGRVVGPAVAQACFFLPADSAVLSVFAASLFAPSFFPSSVFLLPARVSLCPCLSQPASRQLCRAVLLRLYSVWFFSVISCFSVHRPSPAACCPSLVAPSIVQRLPLVVRRPLSIPCRPLSIPCRPLPVTCRPLFIARRLLAVARTPYPVPRTPPRLFPLPFGPDHGFCIRGIPACVSAGAACRVVPQRVPSVGLSAKMRPPSVPWSPRRF